MLQGIQRVLEEAGQYAFLIEGKSAEWAMGQHCGLVTVGGNINIRNYGIAVKQGRDTSPVHIIFDLFKAVNGISRKFHNIWRRL